MREGTQILLQVQKSREMTKIVPEKSGHGNRELRSLLATREMLEREKVRGDCEQRAGRKSRSRKEKEQSWTEGGKRGEAGEGRGGQNQASLGMVSHMAMELGFANPKQASIEGASQALTTFGINSNLVSSLCPLPCFIYLSLI